MSISKEKREPRGEMPLWLAVMPVVGLLLALGFLIVCYGADSVQSSGPLVLLGASLLALAVWKFTRAGSYAELRCGIIRSARQVLPSLPILLLIGTVSATWMLSGVVPLMIKTGLQILDANMFLMIACAVSALISVLTGSSWTTIATIGVAFMGIGGAMGYSEGWIAGAVISGAYFGDKISPLSDTTVLASSSCGVNLFSHIRYMMLTSLPSMALTLAVFAVAGLLSKHTVDVAQSDLIHHLDDAFNLSPWLLCVPAATALMIALRSNCYATLGVSTAAALVAMLVFQPDVVGQLSGTMLPGAGDYVAAGAKVLATSTSVATQSAVLDDLVGTSGALGMLPTVWLVACAMMFGGVMIGTGMLRTITGALARKLKSRHSTVSATVASGLALNACTGDQYLSIIISSNVYSPMYETNGLERRLLSRTVEDSVSVTSVLIPWNSCGLAQSAVLGVGTLTYLPYCVFNLVSPLMSLAMAWGGLLCRRKPAFPSAASAEE